MRTGLVQIVLACATCATTACAIGSIPDPKDAARDFAQAADRGDTNRIYDMMTSEGHKERTREDVRHIIEGEHQELVDEAKAVTAPATRVQATARLHFDDGEETALELRGGRFWVTSAG